jgi:hypothetical protein
MDSGRGEVLKIRDGAKLLARSLLRGTRSATTYAKCARPVKDARPAHSDDDGLHRVFYGHLLDRCAALFVSASAFSRPRA